ncbi:F-box protein-like [Abeliophyllum distichum]|uniref:F-box protein-like n=1 Tax=Abeliophyllum distichum TaxID=126358 RepID=A0ABD1QSX7_9LAMI
MRVSSSIVYHSSHNGLIEWIHAKFLVSTCKLFFNFRENRVFRLNSLKSLQESYCAGSPHRWLVILNKKEDSFLMEIIPRTGFSTARKRNFSALGSVHETENEEFEIKYKCEKDSVPTN